MRPGERPPRDAVDRRPETMAARIEAVWTLTKIAAAWTEGERELRLQRLRPSPIERLVAEFCAQRVEFLVVGAHALAAHGHVRATKDLDVFIRAEPENARRAFAALAAFGAPLSELTETDLATPGLVFQIGVPPVRIDILTAIDGVSFDEAWRERIAVSLGALSVPVISKRHLIANKKASGRLQDLADVERLEADVED